MGEIKGMGPKPLALPFIVIPAQAGIQFPYKRTRLPPARE